MHKASVDDVPVMMYRCKRIKSGLHYAVVVNKSFSRMRSCPNSDLFLFSVLKSVIVDCAHIGLFYLISHLDVFTTITTLMKTRLAMENDVKNIQYSKHKLHLCKFYIPVNEQ